MRGGTGSSLVPCAPRVLIVVAAVALPLVLVAALEWRLKLPFVSGVRRAIDLPRGAC
jgi:hypothetical protein